MDTLKLGLSLLTLTYGFTLSYHLMGAAKYINIHEFNFKKFFLGILKETGFVIFWLLVCLMQRYLDLSSLGIDIDITSIINIILIAPLVSSIKDAYNKAVELRNVKDKAQEKSAEEIIQIKRTQGPKVKHLTDDGGLG